MAVYSSKKVKLLEEQETLSNLSEFKLGLLRNITGANNNAAHVNWGKAGTAISMKGPVDYADGVSQPSGTDRPSSREISNEIFAQSGNIPSVTGTSNFLWMWGQLLDHDVSLSPTNPAEKIYIPVPTGDPYFDPFSTGTKTIPLDRSVIVEGSGTDVDNPREQINSLTTWLDASHVYGSDPVREGFLRGEGGHLKTSAGDMMPFNTAGLMNGNSNPFVAATDLFVGGDVRANENSGLIAMHTLFVRQHNKIVDTLKEQNPALDAEELYQSAKALVEAKMRAITFNQFLPIILGKNAIPAYQGYNPDINPVVVSEFSSAAYRIGHTLLNATLTRMDEKGNVTDTVSLKEVFFNPSDTLENGLDGLMRGQAATLSQNLDHFIIDDVRNFLFGPPGAGGLDLVSLNIERAREHGVPDYNTVREAYGLQGITSFSDITADSVLAGKLQALYGSVDNIDLFVAGLCEDPFNGGLVGETFHAIILDQFVRIRDADIFWYENRFEGQLLEDLQNYKLEDVIRDTTGVDYLQNDIFYAADRIGGTNASERLYGDDGRDLLLGFGGRDLLQARGGNDTLYGGADRDTLSGGDGDDYLDGGKAKDYVDGGRGDDILIYDCMDTLIGGKGLDTLRVEDDMPSLKFTLNSKMSGIDILDLTDGESDNFYASIHDILKFTDDSLLYVLGDDRMDQVVVADRFTATGQTVSLNGQQFSCYIGAKGSDLMVEEGISVITTTGSII